MSDQTTGPSTEELELLLVSLVEQQEKKVLAFARRLHPGVTQDDVKNPHDFPQLFDPDFNYEDGTLAGLNVALAALRRLKREHASE
jgi:hypothetical protein